jgi:hypothetical protein
MFLRFDSLHHDGKSKRRPWQMQIVLKSSESMVGRAQEKVKTKRKRPVQGTDRFAGQALACARGGSQ